MRGLACFPRQRSSAPSGRPTSPSMPISMQASSTLEFPRARLGRPLILPFSGRVLQGLGPPHRLASFGRGLRTRARRPAGQARIKCLRKGLRRLWHYPPTGRAAPAAGSCPLSDGDHARSRLPHCPSDPAERAFQLRPRWRSQGLKPARLRQLSLLPGLRSRPMAVLHDYAATLMLAGTWGTGLHPPTLYVGAALGFPWRRTLAGWR